MIVDKAMEIFSAHSLPISPAFSNNWSSFLLPFVSLITENDDAIPIPFEAILYQSRSAHE